MDILRTPDDRFDDLPEFDFAPRYTTITADDGRRYGFTTSTRGREMARWSS